MERVREWLVDYVIVSDTNDLAAIVYFDSVNA